MKEKRKEPRRYDRESKMNAVKLYREEDRSLVKVAEGLEIPMTTLAQWVEEFKEYSSESFPGSGSNFFYA